MREIKFRGWIKEPTHSKGGYMNGTYEGEWWLGLEVYTGKLVNIIGKAIVDAPNKIILMQYTGLKDKNGKEIYEGDILKSQEDKILGSVGFENGCFVLKAVWIDPAVNDYPELKYYIDLEFMTVEVIGNIYENPELLTELK